jgi:hypothetical protein
MVTVAIEKIFYHFQVYTKVYTKDTK